MPASMRNAVLHAGLGVVRTKRRAGGDEVSTLPGCAGSVAGLEVVLVLRSSLAWGHLSDLPLARGLRAS